MPIQPSRCALLASVLLANQLALAAGKVGYELTIGPGTGGTNTPRLILTNRSDTAAIVRFTFTVGDTRRNFDIANAANAFTNPGVVAQIITPDAANGGVRSDSLHVVFTGLTPGKAASIETDLDSDAVDSTEDFTKTFFNNGDHPNSSIRVEFGDGSFLSQDLPDAPENQTSFLFAQSAPQLTQANAVQEAFLKSPSTASDNQFGWKVAAHADTVVIGEPGAGGGVGAAHVFVRSNGVWSQQAVLKGSRAVPHDVFGSAVAISGDTIAVGAPGGLTPPSGSMGPGAVYVFIRNGSLWSEQAFLKGANTDGAGRVTCGTGAAASLCSGQFGDRFGISVSLDGDTLAVGAVHEDSDAKGIDGNGFNDLAIDSGAAYVFSRRDGVWSQQAFLKSSNAEAGDWFGESVGLSGNTLVVGARLESSKSTQVNGDQSDNSARSSGAAYVFVRTGSVWRQQAYLKAFNAAAGAIFGEAVAIAGDTIVVGATNERLRPGSPMIGAAHIFVRNGATWTEQANLKPSNADTVAGGSVGRAIAISPDRIVLGQNERFGHAWVFARSGSAWREIANLIPSNGRAFRVGPFALGPNFGASVAISSNLIIVGAPYEPSAATGINGDQFDNSAPLAGAVYPFKIDLPPTATLTPSPASVVAREVVTLSWTTTNATAVFMDRGIGPLAPSGRISVAPESTTTYTLTATGPGGTTTTSATILVRLPAASLSVDSNLIAPGESVTLRWETSDAADVALSPDIGPVSASGSRQVYPENTTTYTLTARNAGNSTTATATVTVTPLVTDIRNALDESHGLYPGAPILIRGKALSQVELSAEDPLPAKLGGVSVMCGPVAALLYSVSPERIIAAVPAGINVPADVQVRVFREDGSTVFASPPFPVAIRPEE